MPRRSVADLALAVRDSGRCVGCGLCATLDNSIVMAISREGFSRPVRNGDHDPESRRAAVRDFRRACPGLRIDSPQRAAPPQHHDPILGDYLEMWRGWAVDPAVRARGSSGGVLTALSTWLLKSGVVSGIGTVAASPIEPIRTLPITAVNGEQMIASAGSRYCPSPTLDNATVLQTSVAVVAKPCEASALRQLGFQGGVPEEAGPLKLSFFCAGVPSLRATKKAITATGANPDALVELRYRGGGWPGTFRARDVEGNGGDLSYDESWGAILGRDVQWRCKLCPDGVGESADIVAADFWAADDRGYPTFTDAPGESAIIARTQRGKDAVLAAAQAGVIEIRPAELGELRQVQPLHEYRRSQLFGRLMGARLAGRRVPSYRGFHLLRLGIRRPVKFILRPAVGTFTRSLARRATK